MKSYCFYLFLVFSAFSFAQENKADSIRWIRIQKNAVNKSFFHDTYTNRNFETLIGCFWENAHNSSSVFFIEHSDIAEKQKLYFELKKQGKNDSLLIGSYNKHYVKKIDSLFKENIVFNFNEGLPYLNEFGEDYEIDCVSFFQFTSGQICFSYPPEFAVLLSMEHISEIRIREELQLIPGSKEYKYVPTAMQLYTNHQENLENNIWMDLSRLKLTNPEIVHTEWFQDLVINRYFSGEQYMQIKCN